MRKVLIGLVVLALGLSGCGGTLLSAEEQWVEDTLSGMTIQQKVGQVIVSGIVGTEMTPEMCLHLQTYMPGGVILQQENIQNPRQVRRLVQEIEKCAGQTQPVPVLVTLAHEGETVNRFGETATIFPSAQALGATGEPHAAYRVAEITGRELAYMGFNMVLGPDADVLRNLDSSIIAERSYGSDPEQVSKFVEAAVKGYLAAGLIPVLKHYPGHGGVAEDSHETLPIDRASLAELEENYLPPFVGGRAAGAQVIMTSHIAFPEISGDETPATLSKPILDDLRKRLDFDWVIMSDAMRMKGVTGEQTNIRKSSLQALKAGVDLLLLNFAGHAGQVHVELVDAIMEKRLDEKRLDEAVRAVLRLKSVHQLMTYATVPTYPMTEQADPDLALREPDWAADQAEVDEIARRTVTLLRDPGERVPLLPLKGAGRVLVLAPALNNWSADEALAAALQIKGAQADVRYYPAPWGDTPLGEAPPGEADLAEILAMAQGYDQVVVFTWQAHILKVTTGADWQGRLVSELQASGVPLVVVAARSLTDALEFPVETTVVGMLGTMAAQQEALVAVLMGEMEAEGVNPLGSD